ncbi:hypothetical protein KC850_03755 [Candidatus Kaiserbacteria bacterium]|nr:hypothetical protein [Candidatus Kaiserbacteria bacterium]MCB9818341.1 hypothetical protein [Candidatus Nomurabacteria bacterium]
MKESFENPSATPPTETSGESEMSEQPDESLSAPESVEVESYPIEDTPQERVEALEEGIRLTEIGRDTALADLERWRNNNTTEPSHFEFHLPEIQNRISRAEHSISSSRLDIDLINSGAESPEQEDEVVKGFVADQVIDQRTAELRNQLSSFDKQEADFNERIERNHRATEKLQAELDDLNTSIESGDPDSDRLKLHRRDVLVEMSGVSDRYETLMKEKEGIDVLAQNRESVQSEIDAVVAAGVSEEELPKSLKEDPDYAACLKEADTYSSDDDREFKRNIKYDPSETAEKLFRDRFPQKSAYYDRMTPAEVGTAKSKPIVETEGGIESPTEITKVETIKTIREQMGEGKINKEPDYERLKGEPIIDTKTLYDVEPSRAEQSIFEFVETDKIVGRPNADNYENGWAHEYDERGGRISEIVQQVNNPEDETGIERIFHTEDGTNERIKLASYEGPAGPIYSVFDGTHRVAGIKASGLEKMPAEIFRTEYPYEKTTADSEEVADWQDKIDRGFIVGSIETIETKNGERSLLKIESEVLPWIRVRNQNDIFKINQVYEQQYPGALELVGFPKETLTDKTALWAYMDGNFDKWRERRSVKNSKTKSSLMKKDSNFEQMKVSSFLQGEKFNAFFESYEDKKAREILLGFASSLLMQCDDSLDSLTLMMDELRGVDFNELASLPDHKIFNEERKLLFDSMINLESKNLSVDFDSNIESALDVCLSLYDKQMGVMYHGTNSVALREILESGRAKSSERGFEADLDRLSDILERNNVPKNEFIGWYDINSSNKLFLTGSCESSGGAVNYAKGSPEWLNVMTDGAFSERDYEKAKRNVLRKVQSITNRKEEYLKAGYKNVSEEDGDEIISTFEKYWSTYADSNPVLLRVEGLEQDNTTLSRLATDTKVLMEIGMLENIESFNPSDMSDPEIENFIKKNITPEDLKLVFESNMSWQRNKTDERIDNGFIDIKDIKPYNLPNNY